jgi:surfactin synthase thioesterase subunit
MPPDMLAAAVSVLRSDCLLVAEHAAVADHVAQGRLLRCPVLVLGGDADAGVDPEDLREWAAVTKGRTSTHVLSGGHFYYRNRLDEIGELIERALS